MSDTSTNEGANLAGSPPAMDPQDSAQSAKVTAASQEPASSPPPSARIRPYKASTDLKIVRYLVGAQAMEPSSLANQEALYKPVALILWAVMTWVAVVYFGRGWPTSLLRALRISSDSEVVPGGSHTLLQHLTEYLSVLPMLVAPPIVLLALFEFRHRYMFEAEMSRAIAEEDMRDIDGYYGQTVDSSSVERRSDLPRGFWVLEYDARIIGAMGLDSRKPGAELDSLVDKSKATVTNASGSEAQASSTAIAAESSSTALRTRSKAPQTNKGNSAVDATKERAALPDGTLHLRRFATSYTFRPSDIEDDLLDFVAAHAFASQEVKDLVITLRPSIEKGLARRLAKNGWTLLEKGDRREAASARKREHESQRLRDGSGWKRAVDALWPIELEVRTYVIERSTWESKNRA